MLRTGLGVEDPWPSRSEAELSVVRALCEAGASREDVVWFFRRHPWGIAERTFERGLGSLERTIAKVWSTSRPERAPRPERAATRVRLETWSYARRLALYLRVVETGEEVIAGISDPRGLGYARAAFGLREGEAWMVAAGRETDVVLQPGACRSEVAYWLTT